MKKLQKTLLSLLTIPTVILSSCGINSSTNNSEPSDRSSVNNEIIVVPAETPEAPVLASPEANTSEETSESINETAAVTEPETATIPVPTPTPPAPVTPTPVVEAVEKKEAEKVTTDTKEEEVTETPDTSDNSTETKTEESTAESSTDTSINTEEINTEKVEAVEETPAEEVTSNSYKNGSYTQSGSYASPAGSESISVTLSISDDTVSSVSVNPNATHEVSKKFQGKFASGISTQVVGKKLSELGSIGAVNGSSLTGGGFNTAIASIKSSAK
ncbi:hypothetical protein HON22_02850 [Candidatus Peregrinibacteria bacterium]|jgi:hypothetical protein|nr:hypothetical protein [Candidatus Peregrinibacteria bacterium]